MALRFDTLDGKIDSLTGKITGTSWDHHGDTREAFKALTSDNLKAFDTMAREIQSIRDLVIAGGVRALPDSTE